MKTVWCYFPPPGKDIYQLPLVAGLIGIGFGGLGDVRALATTREDLKLEWIRQRSWQSEGQVNTLYSMLYHFVFTMKIGDLVVYPPTRYERVIHVGTVTGDYQYGDLHPLGRDLRTVDWIAEFPRDAFNREALRGIEVTLALFQVRNETFLGQLDSMLNASDGKPR